MKRGLTIEEAAEHCGVSVSGFRDWLAKGRVPGPWPGTRRWDRKALDKALDEASGINEDSATDSPYERWRARYEGLDEAY